FDALYHRAPTDDERTFWAEKLENGAPLSLLQAITDRFRRLKGDQPPTWQELDADVGACGGCAQRLGGAGFSPAAVASTSWETSGRSTLLNGWLPAGNNRLVGDFLGLGHDQVLFLQRVVPSQGVGRVLIADFSDGKAPAEVLYSESYGDSSLLTGWMEDGNRQ